MKKIISILTAVVLILTAFSGCTQDTKNPVDESESYVQNGGDIVLGNPSGKTVGIHTEKQAGYLAGDYSKISSFAKGKKELSKPEPVSFSWSGKNSADTYTINISENSDMSDSMTFTSDVTTAEIYNLKIATKYYWTVSADGDTSGVGSFETEDILPRNINVDGVTNVRDLGGYMTSGGTRTKQGMIYRCGRLNKSSAETPEIEITAEGIKTMRDDLRIKTEIDLRRADNGEVGAITKSPLGPDINYVNCPMDWEGNMFEKNPEEIKRVFAILADENNYPVIFHCNIGTDRTGMIAFLVNALLGVEEKDLFTDYLYSNFGNIGGSRSIDGNLMKCGYYDAIKNSEGASLSEKTYNCLVGIGVPAQQLDSVIAILG